MPLSADLVWDCRCRLGEGAVWNVADASLYFVDIHGREILAWTPATGAQRRWTVPDPVSFIVPRTRGGWIAGCSWGLAALQLVSEPVPRLQIEPLHRLHPQGSPLWLNDGKVDAAGRLWFGSLNRVDMGRPDGALYRWTPGEVPRPVETGYRVPNGPTFSVDGRTLFHTDSARSAVDAHDLADDGGLSARRAWLQFNPGEGHPDGMCTDAQDAVWIAHWDGSRVTRRDAAGAVTGTVLLPVPRVTTVAFGGERYEDLYVTSARAGLDAAALLAAPLSGGLFVVRGAGRGLAPHAFGG